MRAVVRPGGALTMRLKELVLEQDGEGLGGVQSEFLEEVRTRRGCRVGVASVRRSVVT